MAFFDNFPNVIAGLLQRNFLAREMEEGLDSVLAYRRLAIPETFPGRIGETLTRTRKGRKAPNTTPLTPSAMNNADNGMTPGGAFSIEQYSFTMQGYGDTLDLNLMQTEAQIADQFIANARNLGVQAAQSLERICRQKLFSAYLGGNSRAIADPGAGIISNSPGALPGSINNAATSALYHVDDVRGFQTVLVSGVVTPVSPTNKLDAVVTKATGVTVAVKVQLATEDLYQSGKSAADITSTPDAKPGFLTLENVSGSTYTIAAGDVLVANNAPAIFRPQDRKSSALVTASDILTMSILEDTIAYLRDNGVPPMDDGTFHITLDNTSMRQLWADQDFKLLYTGSETGGEEFGNMQITRMLNMTFIPTTEAYVQAPIAAGGPKIRRPIVAGAECMIQGNFEGMETWLAARGFDRNDSNIALIDGIIQIVREPLDRLQQVVAQSWHWIGDYAIPTDLTATTSIIPTASNAMFKRCAVIEHAG